MTSARVHRIASAAMPWRGRGPSDAPPLLGVALKDGRPVLDEGVLS